MKLLTRTTLYNLMFLLPVLAAGGVLFFVVINSIIKEEFDEKLMDDKTQLINSFAKKDSITEAIMIGGNIQLIPVDKVIEDRIYDTSFYSTIENEMVAYRQITFSASINNKNYLVTISKPLVEKEDLAAAIVMVILAIMVSIMLIIALFNYFISKRTWKPFKDSLEKMKLFNLSRGSVQDFGKTGIKEFSELNRVLEEMTKRIGAEFSRMKEFTGNVSHELQTPLAVIKTKLEMMMQSKGMSEDQFRSVTELHDSVDRLAKINQSLILITRIENRQFKEVTAVDLAEIIKEKLDHYQELLTCTKLKINLDIKEPLSIKMNPELADIFIGNLISNAIRHNIEHGQIQILADRKGITITNTGNPLLVVPDELFERFKKNDQSSPSLGLGLAIVRQIADLYNFGIKYIFQNGNHIISVSFF